MYSKDDPDTVLQEFSSLKEASDFLGVHYTSILKSMQNLGTCKGYIFKPVNEPKYEVKPPVKKENKTKKAVVMFSVDDLNTPIREFESVKKAADYLEVDPSTIFHQMAENRPSRGFLFKKKDDPTPVAPPRESRRRKKQEKVPRKISVLMYDPKDLSIPPVEFPSMEQASKHLGRACTAVGKAIKAGKLCSGYLFRYSSDTSPLQVPDAFKNPTISVGMYHVDDPDTLVREFDSMKEAAAFIKKTSATLAYAMERGNAYDGYLFRKLSEKTNRK